VTPYRDRSNGWPDAPIPLRPRLSTSQVRGEATGACGRGLETSWPLRFPNPPPSCLTPAASCDVPGANRPAVDALVCGSGGGGHLSLCDAPWTNRWGRCFFFLGGRADVIFWVGWLWMQGTVTGCGAVVIEGKILGNIGHGGV
jgi:hypothetical protein